ncbi:MAG: trigger factor [Magnetococcales bacterium]|nr:trigger factor [Magnetococcales bacterium]
MEVTVEEKGTYDRNLNITIPAERVSALWDRELGRLGQNVRLPGFRPGKVPRKVLEQRFGGQVAAGVAEDLFKATYFEALTQKGLKPIDMPRLTLGRVVRGETFSYTAAIQVFPDRQPEGYKDMPLQRPRVEISDGDVDQVVERIRSSNTVFHAEEGRRAANGDQVLMDFEGRVAGELFPGGSAKDYALTLGSGHFIPGFESQLEGIGPGEERNVEVTFPGNYHNKDLAGKPAVFSCTVKQVRRPELPALDDTLAEKAGVKEGGFEKLRSEIRVQLEKQAQGIVERQLKKQILDQLLTRNRFELPSQLVDRELDALMERAKGEKPEAERTPQWEESLREKLRSAAEDRVILGFTISVVARTEAVEVDEASVESYLDDMGAQFGEHAAQMKSFIKGNKERMEEIRGAVLEKKVMDWIVDHGQVTDLPRTFADLVKDQENEAIPTE